MNETTRTKICDVCKAPMEEEPQDYIVELEGDEILVEDVPLWVCEQCGYSVVDEDVIEAIEDLLAHMDTVLADEEE